MSVSGVGSSVGMTIQSLVGMRKQLDDLQRQLGTGKKSADYAGVGVDRGVAVGLRSRMSALDGYASTITGVGVRTNLAKTALDRMITINSDTQTTIRRSAYQIDFTGQTPDQQNARFSLDEQLGLLKTQSGDRYLFSGRAGDQVPVETMAHILDGDGTRAGLRQIIAERYQADFGLATSPGRLDIPAAAGNVVSISEEIPATVFGMKLGPVASNLTNATVAGPAGTPPQIDVDFTAGQPNAGETIRFTLTLPDGSTQDVTLTAGTTGQNPFAIGATTGDTAINLQAALASAVGKVARTTLAGASAVAAGNDFFNIDDANPPQRVDGPPFDTATQLIDATPANTVTWYTGEGGSDPARGTAVARVDQSISVQYGLRANEQATRLAVQNIAVFAATSYSSTDADAQDKYLALTDRLDRSMGDVPGQQRLFDIMADLATADATMGAAADRHAQTGSVLTGLLDSIEGVSIEEVAAQVLALNTRLQASLQTTSMLAQISLVNYL
jgi:flagellar hook-associated protein 3 FlgL